MKQLKLMVLALTLLMGTMFTSCMDSGENGPQQWAGVVKVKIEWVMLRLQMPPVRNLSPLTQFLLL